MTPSLRALSEGMLYTDAYQLTMAQLYFRTGLHELTAQFDHFFRSYPDYGAHQAGYCVNAGLEWLLDWMAGARFDEASIGFLREQRGLTGNRLYGDDFLDWLKRYGSFDGITMRAVPEGRVVHANAPLTIVQGPLVMAQILETPLLNLLNYQILIATKAARIKEAGRGRPLLEFGLRRGPEKGSNAGTRASLIGGADYSSNTGLSYAVGLTPKGTHAHSMVQVFIAVAGGELEAFRAYAEHYPDDCLLLVDTVNTLESGVPNAIKVFEELRSKGHRPVGIRLDSGDLAYLSIRAARMLDDAGFGDAAIVLSSDLDELIILQIINQIQEEAPRYGVDPDRLIGRFVFGVGTRLITSEGDPALDGVYKLVGVRKNGAWIPALKISESVAKVPNPGTKNLWRIYDRRNMAIADVVGTEDEDPRAWERMTLHHHTDASKSRTIERSEVSAVEPLLTDVLRDGKLVNPLPSLDEMRKRRAFDMERLDPGVKRLVNPHRYHVSLTDRLWNLKQELIMKVKVGPQDSNH